MFSESVLNIVMVENAGVLLENVMIELLLRDILFLFNPFVGKCAVLSFKDFLSCRPTEINENDVLLCESRYNESDKQMKKFKGLKRFSLSAKVVDDEIYYFR